MVQEAVGRRQAGLAVVCRREVRAALEQREPAQAVPLVVARRPAEAQRVRRVAAVPEVPLAARAEPRAGPAEWWLVVPAALAEGLVVRPLLALRAAVVLALQPARVAVVAR